jgi:hypothetical protein
MDLHTLLVIGHIAGTILGVGGATIAEVQVIQALKDGKVDASERALMHANYWVIRLGIAIILLSGLTLVWWWLTTGNSDWVLTSHKIWMKDLMLVVIIVNAVLLTKHWIPFWLGSALSFTSWWGATILGAWDHVPYTFTTLLISYVVAIGIVAAVLHFIKKYFIGAPPK